MCRKTKWTENHREKAMVWVLFQTLKSFIILLNIHLIERHQQVPQQPTKLLMAILINEKQHTEEINCVNDMNSQ